MKTMTKAQWWCSLTECDKEKYRNEFGNTYMYTLAAYNKYYLNEQPEFTSGQQVWVDDLPAVYLYHDNKSGIDYFTYGKVGSIAGNEIEVACGKTISATKPLPEIKPGTPVLCWHTDNSCKTISIFVAYDTDGKPQTSDTLDSKAWLTWDHCEIYKPC